jgi:hypothetical protein
MKSVTLGVLTLALAACGGRDLGTGVNTLDRDYAKPAAETWKAAVKSVESAGLTVTSDPADDLGGDLVARRANGDEVRVRVKSLDEKSSRVTVRVEPGDRDLAKLLHERIAENVGLGEAKSSLFGGNSLDAEYLADLPSCLRTAKGVFDVLQIEKTAEENPGPWAQIDGRRPDSTPVRIRMERLGNGKTRVDFIAGNARNDDNKAFVRRMKMEFESTLRPD